MFSTTYFAVKLCVVCMCLQLDMEDIPGSIGDAEDMSGSSGDDDGMPGAGSAPAAAGECLAAQQSMSVWAARNDAKAWTEQDEHRR